MDAFGVTSASSPLRKSELRYTGVKTIVFGSSAIRYTDVLLHSQLHV